MLSTRLRRLFERFVLFSVIALAAAQAAEFHGTTKIKGLPFPGVAVTATQGEKKVVTTSDLDGVFSFKDLPDGDWNFEVSGVAAGVGKRSDQLLIDRREP